MSTSPQVTSRSEALPTAYNLRNDCNRVREHTPGDPPTRFLQAIEGLDGQALVHAVSKMINKREAVEFREKELERFPNLLTIEDYVSRYGGDWSFDRATIEMASATADYFDRLVGFRRFI